MSDQDDAYEWIQARYQACLAGEITEEEYMQDLEKYKEMLDSATGEEGDVKSGDKKVTKVRSTSIAGLRQKLLEELKKD